MVFIARKTKGFTLVELLLAASLTAVIGLSVYSNFASGVSMMRKLAETSVEEDLAIFFEKFGRELENAFHQKEIPFEGEEEQFSFATTVLSDPLLGGDLSIGKVTYFLSGDGLARRQQNVHDIFEEENGIERTVLQGVSDFRLGYFGYEVTESKYVWTEDWDPVEKKGTIPIALRVEFLYKSEKGADVVKRTVFIPSAD